MSEYFSQLKIQSGDLKKCGEEEVLNEIPFWLTTASPDRKKKVTLEKGFNGGWMMGIPVVEGKRHQRVFLECLCNQIADLTTGMSRSVDPGTGKTENDLPYDMQIMFQNIGAILQYTINSTSIGDEVFHNFDRMELAKRLRMAASMIERS